MILIKIDKSTIFMDGIFYNQSYNAKGERRKLRCDYSKFYCYQCSLLKQCDKKEAIVYKQAKEK